VETLEQRVLMAVAAPLNTDAYQPSPIHITEGVVAIASDTGRQSDGGGGTTEIDNTCSTAAVEMSVKLTKPDGSTLSSLAPDEEFVLHVLVKDLRQAPEGVFAGFLDVAWNRSLAVVTGAAEYGQAYGNLHQGDLSHPGSIDDAGAFASSLSPLGGGQRELFSVRLRAVAEGTLVFSPDPADRLPYHDVLVYGSNTPVSPRSVDYRGATIAIRTEHDFANKGLSPDTSAKLVAAPAAQESAEGESSPHESYLYVREKTVDDATTVITFTLPETLRAGKATFGDPQSGAVPFGDFQIPASVGAARQNLNYDYVGLTDDLGEGEGEGASTVVQVHDPGAIAALSVTVFEDADLMRPNDGPLGESSEVSINALDEFFTELGLEPISPSRLTARRWLSSLANVAG
jgi:hypothetical protein